MRALALAAAGLLLACPVLAQTISGPARVIDGDTIDISGQRVRLHGIDAPEKAQTCRIEGVPWVCGVAAWGELVQLVAGQDVTCDTRDIDRYGRTVAVCTADGEDINAAMVAQGWALADRQFSVDYVAQEGEAREARRGLWAGEFIPPWEWRRGDRLAARPAASPVNQEQNIADGRDNAPGQCLIKGNISSRGERIYHVPGGASYSRTRISPTKGERFFCSEAEAEAAGWRASQR